MSPISFPLSLVIAASTPPMNDGSKYPTTLAIMTPVPILPEASVTAVLFSIDICYPIKSPSAALFAAMSSSVGPDLGGSGVDVSYNICVCLLIASEPSM